MATGGGYPRAGRGKAVSGDTYGKSFVSKTAVWYKIPIIQTSQVTRIRLDPDVCQLLEQASQQRRKEVSFTDKETGSYYTAYLESKRLYMHGNNTLHAHLERVYEEREEDGQRNTAVGRGVSSQTSNENRKYVDTMQRQMMIKQYKDKACQLVAWLEAVINWIMQKEFPANLNDMKSTLAEISRIKTDIPKWNEIKKEMMKIYEDLQTDGAKLLTKEESPGSIQQLCIKFDSEMKNREARLTEEIARLESLESHLKNIDRRLDDIEHRIQNVKKPQDTTCSLQALNMELRDIDDGIKSLLRDTETLQKGGHSNTGQLPRLLEIQSKAAKIRHSLFSSTTLKSPQLSAVLTVQHHKASNGAQMLETNQIFQRIQDCLQWIYTKQATLQGEPYGNTINLIMQELDQHGSEYQSIQDYRKEVDHCIKEREKLVKEEQERFDELHSKVQEAYGKLLDTSSQRLGWLQSLLDFVQKAVKVLDWLRKKIEFISSCSPELDRPYGQIYQDVMQEMKDMETNFLSVQDIGSSLVHQAHPAKIAVKAYISDMESQWSWLLKLLECLRVHISHISAFKMYFQEASECTKWMTQQTENVNNWMRHQNLPMQELEQRKKECQNLQENLVNYEKCVASLAEKSCDIIPYKKQSDQLTSQIKVSCLCHYEQPTISLQKHEECILLDNSEKVRWKVKNTVGQVDTVPSICLIIPPPNNDAVDLANRLKVHLEQLKSSFKTCQRKLTVLLRIEFIKNWDLAQFKSQDPSRCEALLKELKAEADKLIEEAGETDQKIQQQLQTELDECSMKVQEFSKKLCEEVFPFRWEKFEIRFEIEKAKELVRSTEYTMDEISPGQIQYIAENKDERDSLLSQFGIRNFRGVFKLGFLRIYLQENDDIQNNVEDPNYIIHLMKKVTSVLKAHIHIDPVIKEEKLAQFDQDDVQKAQELGLLECLKSRRVKIYICKSGKGVYIVGREVDKYVKSICRALEQVSKNEPESGSNHYQTEDIASSILETMMSNRECNADDVLLEEPLKHAEETEELKKNGEASLIKKIHFTKHITQMLTDSDYAEALSTEMPEVAVHYTSNEVVFKGPEEVLRKAAFHLKQYLTSKSFWHEVNIAKSLIETCKRQNFKHVIQKQIPEVFIQFTDRKIIFVGEEKLIKASEEELCKFQKLIQRPLIAYDSIIVNCLNLPDFQMFIWKQFEDRQITCYWHVIKGGINLFSRNGEEYNAAKSALEECIGISELPFRSESDLQEFENCPDVKNLINQTKGRLHRELALQADCVVYVGMPEVIAQIKELHSRYTIDKKNEPQEHSFQVFLSQPLLAYVSKYLIENMKQKFQVNIQNLDDLSGINISGAEDNVQNAVSEVQKQIQQMSVDIYPLKSPEITNTIDRQVKEIIATVEEETKTVIEIVSLPRRGKDTMRVPLRDKLDVCLVYGSTPGREVDIQLIPVNDSFVPICLAAIDIMEKGVGLMTKAAESLRRYLKENTKKQEIKKPEAFQFTLDDEGSSQHVVYFVIPDDPNGIEQFEEKFKRGLFAILNCVSQRNKTSLSLPLEMHEKLPARQIVKIVLETLKSYLVEIPQQTSIKEMILCSVEIRNQSILRQVLDSITSVEPSFGEYVIEDFFDCDEGVDGNVDIAIVTGSILEQQVDIIVNSASKELDLADGFLTKIILDAAGSTIQDECREVYPSGIKIGEIAVTSAGKLKFRKIFHGALCLADKTDSHLLSLRSLMKNCLEKAKEERCHSIAFPALGIGRLNYSVELVAKEMFRAVTTYATRCGVKSVKFVLPENFSGCLRTFKEMENTRNKLLRDSRDCQPIYEVSFDGYKVKLAITVGNKMTMSDVDVILGNPTASTPVETILLTFNQYLLLPAEKKLHVNRDSGKWSETVYLCLENGLDLLLEELCHAFFYMQLTKLTSCAVHLSQLKKEDDCKSAIGKVIEALDACKSSPGDLETVTILISDDMLQKLTPWFEENVTAQYRNKSFTEKITTSVKGFLRLKIQMTWKKFPATYRDAGLTYFRITGTDNHVIGRSHQAVQKRFKQLEVQTKEKSVKNSDVQGASYKIPEETGSQIDSPKKYQGDSKVYLKFKTEVAKEVLDLIRNTKGEKGVNALVTDLRKKASVDDSNHKVVISSDDFQDADLFQACVLKHYQEARHKARPSQDTTRKHLIDGGNADTKELLWFAYGNTDWDKILTVEGDNLYLTGTIQLKKEVEAAVKTVNQWCQDDLFFTSEEQQKAAEAVSLVRNEVPEVFIKLTVDKIIIKGDNTESLEKAKHRAKVTLGRIKITSRGKRRNLQADGEPFSSLFQDDGMEDSPASLPLDLLTLQHRQTITSKTYYTKEGITVKVYIGDIVRLPVDCIVNAANKNLSHGGGVALAIAKAAGREFDQESEEYVRKHGLIHVTQCCMTSAGKLNYKGVIHVVGPQWSDYKHNEKNRCADDLKKTVVNCLIEANKQNMTSIAVTSISSGIFGVPKSMCAQMYVQGVVEFSKTCSHQFNSVKEIHFVDMLPEMCHLTQLAFDAELNTRKSNEPVVDTVQSQMKDVSPRGQEISTAKIQNASATVRPLSYAKAAAENLGTKQKPYVIKTWDHTRILIYNHDITDIAVDAIVCPVSPTVEGGVVKSVKIACGPKYENEHYKDVMSHIKNIGETFVTNAHICRPNLPFRHIIHVYPPRWVELEQHRHGKNFKKMIQKSVKNIFNEAMANQISSVALPILGIGDKTTPVKIICEYMMDGIATVCADPHMIPDSKMTIHLVTNEMSLAYQLKEIACQQFGQKYDTPDATLNNPDRRVEHGQKSLKVTIQNDSVLSVPLTEPTSSSLLGSKRGNENQKETCPICLDTPVDPRAFKECGHVLCRECMEFTVKTKPVCPVCGKIYGIIIGTQPQGTMTVKTTGISLPGFKNCGTIDILYIFPGGIQTEGHPNPGKPYKGTSRRAYLPDNTEGRRVLSLLRKAFDRQLVFTIGRSVTTGEENTVTWNDIHHKTHTDGGPQNYGYPDPDYLRRVQEELAAKGVTEDS